MADGKETEHGDSSVERAREHPIGTEVEVVELTDLAAIRACEAVQLDAWGFEPLEVVPAAHMRAVQHAGGLLLGALVGGRVVGFAYGFAALPADPWEIGTGIHSHMVAVRPGLQRSGVGRRLKWAQRRWCLDRGMRWMTWTFDPIQARNAHLNFHHLGVRSHVYLADFYGSLGGPLTGTLATDRLLAFWDLGSDPVDARARLFESGRSPDPAEASGAPWLLARDGAGAPVVGTLEPTAQRLRVAVPLDATALLREDATLARHWRHAVREALQRALADGFTVEGFVGGGYLLQRAGSRPAGGAA